MIPQPWEADRVSDLADLLALALPEERLIEDELEPCWSEHSVVLGHDDGVVVAHVDGPRGWVDLLAVRPAARRHGAGSTLLTTAIEWLADAGADRVRLAGSAPWYLWPGVDESADAMLALGASKGFERRPERRHNLVVQTVVQRPVRPDVRRLDREDLTLVTALAEPDHPAWVDELGRGVVNGTAHGVVVDGELLAVGAHSVNRMGWIGPMLTAPHARGAGHGSAVLDALRLELAVAGYRYAEVAWVGPDRFYERAAGARPGRTFAVLERRLRRPA